MPHLQDMPPIRCTRCDATYPPTAIPELGVGCSAKLDSTREPGPKTLTGNYGSCRFDLLSFDVLREDCIAVAPGACNTYCDACVAVLLHMEAIKQHPYVSPPPMDDATLDELIKEFNIT